jgi:hypothetical protein
LIGGHNDDIVSSVDHRCLNLVEPLMMMLCDYLEASVLYYGFLRTAPTLSRKF